MPTPRRYTFLSNVLLQLTLVLGLALTVTTPGLAQPPTVELETLVTGLGTATTVTHAGDNRLFIGLKDGRILIYQNGALLGTPFLDLGSKVTTNSERGLLGLAFHPSYAANGRFFVNYTDLAGNTVVSRFQVSANANVANGGSEAMLLNIPQPAANHNGGQLQFGPDGYLYIATGDGGSANDPGCRAQDNSTLLGKILRLDVDQQVGAPPFHTIPSGNPFLGLGGRDEIWAFGLRNPYRFSFDRATGDLFIGDVGQNAQEEIDFQAASATGGANYGWKVMEGNLCTGSTAGCSFAVPACGAAELTAPILTYGHGIGCSVIGGFVYRGSDIAGLGGRYLYADLCSGQLWAARRVGSSWQTDLLAPTVAGITTFGEDVSGELYTVANGTLSRLTDGVEQPVPGRLTVPDSIPVVEGNVLVTLLVSRRDGSDGDISVSYRTVDGEARAGDDYTAVTATLDWPDGDNAPRMVSVPVLDDTLSESDESFRIELFAPTGGAILGTDSAAVVTIVDDEPAICAIDDTTLCLRDGRFRVRATYASADQGGDGQAIDITSDSGYFWFFSADNPELFVKVLDACQPPFNRFWVFAAGLTDVAITLTVTDIESGEQRQYSTSLGQGFEAIRDTDAFDTCD